MATSYANTGGQGDRTAIITVTGSFTPQGSFSNAVDGASGNNGTDSFGFQTGVTTGNRIRFDFLNSGFKQIINEITWVQQTNAANGTWTVRASDDASSWTDLTTGVAIAGASSTTVISFSNSTAYRYYELLQTSGATTDSPWIQEVTFKIEQGASLTDINIPATSHSVGVTMAAAFTNTTTQTARTIVIVCS